VVAKRTVICGAALLLAASLPVIRANDRGAASDPPMLLWEEETEAILVAPPPSVAAWMSGDVDDPEGVLERMAQDYQERIGSSSFLQAVDELRRIVLVAREGRILAESEINLGLIPEILDSRDDLRDALLGHVPLGFTRPPPCREEPSECCARRASGSGRFGGRLGGQGRQQRVVGTEFRQKLQAVQPVQSAERQQENRTEVRHRQQ